MLQNNKHVNLNFGLLQMKRARIAENFNPVYPYDTTSTPAVPFVSPPFVNSYGFQESPPGVLSLQIAKPLFFNTGKQIALSIGRGLSINSNGELQTVPTIQSQPPLNLTGNTLSLGYSFPLTVTNNNLSLSYSAPLRLVDNSLTFNFTSPLRLTDGSLTFSYTTPLNVVNNSLALNYSLPLRLTNNNLTLGYADPFQVTGSNLSLKIASPSALRVRNGNLQVAAGYGLAIAGNNDLYVRRETPLDVYASGSKEGILYLRLGNNSGLRVINNDLNLNTGQGLQIAGNTLSVKLGNGLRFNGSGAIEISNTQ
nr:short fiber 1 [Rhesus adenovirus 71]WUR08070.1 short fiber 1 [Rhesus adenovirus 72]WUR08094.1 short fiber 1 [Rhesus adenovirus 73]